MFLWCLTSFRFEERCLAAWGYYYHYYPLWHCKGWIRSTVLVCTHSQTDCFKKISLVASLLLMTSSLFLCHNQRIRKWQSFQFSIRIALEMKCWHNCCWSLKFHCNCTETSLNKICIYFSAEAWTKTQSQSNFCGTTETLHHWCHSTYSFMSLLQWTVLCKETVFL